MSDNVVVFGGAKDLNGVDSVAAAGFEEDVEFIREIIKVRGIASYFIVVCPADEREDAEVRWGMNLKFTGFELVGAINMAMPELHDHIRDRQEEIIGGE